MESLLTKTGEITVPCGGRDRTFKFGMLTFQLLEKTVATLETSIEQYGAQFWAGLMVRASVNDLPKDFSIAQALEWVDEMDEEDMAKVLALAETAANRIPNVNARVDGLLGRKRDEKGNIIS